MSCARLRKRLNAYVDGELAPAIEREVAAHVELCLACRARLASLRGVVSLLAEVPEPPPPPVWLAARMAARARSKNLLALPKQPLSDRGRTLAPWLVARVMPMRLATALTAAVGVFAGVAMGTTAARGAPSLPPAPEPTVAAGVEWFGAVPPGGFAASYMVVSEVKR